MRLPFQQPKVITQAQSPEDQDLFDEAFQKKLESLALVSRRVFGGRTRAERRSRTAGSGVEFADYRTYYPGDDYRQVDWNVYGRIDRLMLRLHEQEEDLSVYVLLDCSASMAFGAPRKLDFAKKLTAALAYVALAHLDRVSITALRETTGERLAPTRGKNHIFTVLEFLRPLQARGRTNLADAVGAFVAQNRRRGVVLLVSDLYDPSGFEQAVRRLRYGRFDTHVLHVIDPSDAAPGLAGDIDLVDAETGEVRQITLTPQLLRRYEQAYQHHCARIAALCVKQQVGLFSLDTQTPPEEAMLRLLRRGGLVA